MSTKKRFSPEELRTYREYFETFDLDGDGSISAKELGKASRQLGYRLTQDQILKIMTEYDVDVDGQLSFDEFLQAMPGNFIVLQEEDHSEAEMRRRFMAYDADGNGYVSHAEAHKILKKQLAFTTEQSAALLKKYDVNGDGRLSYEEFVGFFSKIEAKAKKLRGVFNEFDTDGSGSVSVAEITKKLRKLGYSDDKVAKLVEIHDTNNDGELQYEEFVPFLLDL